MTTEPRMALPAISILVTALALAGCTGASPSASPGASPGASPAVLPADRPSLDPPARYSPSPGTAIAGEVPPAIVDEARTMLATEVGVDAASSAEPVVAEAVTWPDGSLGCPAPGQVYTQALVPGYRIVFEVDGTRYDFRATAAGHVVQCEPGGPRTP